MKRLDCEKLIKIIEEKMKHGKKNIRLNEMETIYEEYGDDVFIDRSVGDYVLTKNGKDL